MCHPGAIGLMRNLALRKGVLWVPYSIGGTPAIDFLEGATWQFGPVAAVGYTVPLANFLGLPNPPKATWAWPANAIIAGLAFLREYTLYLAGY